MGCGVSARRDDDDDQDTLNLTVTYDLSKLPPTLSALKKAGNTPRPRRSVRWNDDQLTAPMDATATPNQQSPLQEELEPPQLEVVAPDRLWVETETPSKEVQGEDISSRGRSNSYSLSVALDSREDPLQVSMLQSPDKDETSSLSAEVVTAAAEPSASPAVRHWVAHTTVVSLFTALRLASHGSFRAGRFRVQNAAEPYLGAWSALALFSDPLLDPFGDPMGLVGTPLVRGEEVGRGESTAKDDENEEDDCGDEDRDDGDGDEVASCASSASFRCLPRAESFRESQLLVRDRSLELDHFAHGLASAISAIRSELLGRESRDQAPEYATTATVMRPVENVERPPLPLDSGSLAGSPKARRCRAVRSMFLTTTLSPEVLAAWDSTDKSAAEDFEVGCKVHCAFPLNVSLESSLQRSDRPRTFAAYFSAIATATWQHEQKCAEDGMGRGSIGAEKGSLPRDVTMIAP